MATDTQERPGVQEQYETAGNTSDLKVEAEKRGAGDVMIAGGYAAGVDAPGMSPTRLGMALLRLHSEWSSAAKPKRLAREALDTLIAGFKSDDAVKRQRCNKGACESCTPKTTAQERAQDEADRWFSNELRILALGLKSRVQVWDGLGAWARKRGIATEQAAEALQHWLHPVCQVCEGHGLLKAPNAPALSARQCHKCYGLGSKPAPQGTGAVLGHLDYCLGLARGSLRQRLRDR